MPEACHEGFQLNLPKSSNQQDANQVQKKICLVRSFEVKPEDEAKRVRYQAEKARLSSGQGMKGSPHGRQASPGSPPSSMAHEDHSPLMGQANDPSRGPSLE